MRRRRARWRIVYELLAARIDRPEWTFMNYGFEPAEPERRRTGLEPPDEPDRLFVQLYDHALQGTDLSGREVLEVGSGRGGGASYVSRYHRPAAMTGMDLAAAAVALAERTRGRPGLSFVRGDAQAMPFEDRAFDAVVNVESSHCYDSMDAFLAEVHRVLRPGGTFHWADFRTEAGAEQALAGLTGAGLQVERAEDVTEGVLRALGTDNARREGLIRDWIPGVARPVFRRFAAVQGTRMQARFASGELRYLSVSARRPLDAASPTSAP